jgi:hypothetical protein
MDTLTMRVYRPWTDRFEDVHGRLELHQARSRMLHGMVDALDLTVEDWGQTDTEYPREVVEIVIALGSAALSAAIGEIVRHWLERGKVKEVEIVRPDGTTIAVRGLTKAELKQLGKMMWANRRERSGGN